MTSVTAKTTTSTDRPARRKRKQASPVPLSLLQENMNIAERDTTPPDDLPPGSYFPMAQLPDELVLVIARMSGGRGAAKLMRMNLRFYFLIKDCEEIWKSLLSEDFGTSLQRKPINGWYAFYSSRMQRANRPRHPPPRPPSPDLTPTPRRRNENYVGGGLWLVDYLKDVRIREDGGKEYLVKWRGYEERHNSWEVEENIASQCIVAFYANMNDAPATTATTTTTTTIEEITSNNDNDYGDY